MSDRFYREPVNSERYSIESGWLVEHVGHHTCGDGESGRHEPGCGTEGIAPVEELLAAIDGSPDAEQGSLDLFGGDAA